MDLQSGVPTLTQAGRDALDVELKYEDEDEDKDADAGGRDDNDNGGGDGGCLASSPTS